MRYLLLTLLLLPLVTHAQFEPLVGIPGVSAGQGIASYVQALYILAISIAAFLAVVKIIFSGVQYILSDVVTDKGEAKKGIRGAILGLLIVLAAVLILNTINPQLTNLDVLRNAFSVDVGTGGSFNLNSGGLPDGVIEVSAENTEAVEQLIDNCGEGMTVQRNIVNGVEVVACVPDASVNPEYENIDDENCLANGGRIMGSDGACSIDQAGCDNIPGSTYVGGNCYFSGGDAVDGGNSGVDGEPLVFDLTGSFTFNDPADPELGLEAGPNHGQPLTLVAPAVPITGGYREAVQGDTVTGYYVQTPNGTFYQSCSLITPTPPGC